MGHYVVACSTSHGGKNFERCPLGCSWNVAVHRGACSSDLGCRTARFWFKVYRFHRFSSWLQYLHAMGSEPSCPIFHFGETETLQSRTRHGNLAVFFCRNLKTLKPECRNSTRNLSHWSTSGIKHLPRLPK